MLRRLNIQFKYVLIFLLIFFIALSTVNAIDNSTDVQNLTPSNIRASDYTAYEGVKNTYKVVLTADDTPLIKKTIKFTINNKTTTKKTNSKGEASINLDLKEGKYAIKYSYDGDSKTLNFTGKSKITVKKTSPVKFKRISPNTLSNKIPYFQIKILDVRLDPIKNAKVIFKVNKIKYTRKTDNNGIASLKLKLKEGKYIVKVAFPKTSNFKKASSSYKINYKIKRATNNGFWIFSGDMFDVNFKTLQKYGIKHIFLNAKAIENYGKKSVLNFIKEAKAFKIKVHIWMQVFYSKKSGWQNPIKNSHINYKLLNSKVKLAKSYAKLKGVSGVHFDYIRYPGNAYKYKDSLKAINYFVKSAAKAIHKINKSLIVSAAVMPEPSCLKKYYGQDITTMGRYLDAIVPMVYKNNYNGGHLWIQKTVKTFALKSKHAKIWCGLQGYDKNVKKLSKSDIMGDALAASNAGAYGIILFRFGLFNYINFNEV